MNYFLCSESGRAISMYTSNDEDFHLALELALWPY